MGRLELSSRDAASAMPSGLGCDVSYTGREGTMFISAMPSRALED